jgi:hypothetical protein
MGSLAQLSHARLAASKTSDHHVVFQHISGATGNGPHKFVIGQRAAEWASGRRVPLFGAHKNSVHTHSLTQLFTRPVRGSRLYGGFQSCSFKEVSSAHQFTACTNNSANAL